MKRLVQSVAGKILRGGILAVAVACSLLESALCQHVPFAALPEEEAARLYRQARVTPGARQIGLSCAFFANVPVLTMAGGINIADGSVEAREFAASIYGLRRGDFRFMSAFDRGMFFDLFGIPCKSVTVYHRDASRGDLLADAEEIVRRDLTAALDQGQFASLRVLGEFGGPHNVLLLAHRAGTYYYHDPRTGRITASPAAEMASRILSVSKARSTTKKRYFTSYHLVSIPAPPELIPKPLTLSSLAAKLEIEPTAKQMESISLKLSPTEGAGDVAGAFPHIGFVASRPGRSAISKDLPVEGLHGVFNLSKLAINSHSRGARNMLPVWMMADGPLAMTGYGEGDGRVLVFSDGNRRISMGLGEALEQFRERGCHFGYIPVPDV